MEDPPTLACSLPLGEQAERRRELRTIAAAALLARRRSADGIVLTYRSGPGVEEALDDLIAREAECCPFIDFELRRGEGELVLTASAPRGAEAVLDAIHDASAP